MVLSLLSLIVNMFSLAFCVKLKKNYILKFTIYFIFNKLFSNSSTPG